ncbi:MAG: M14 family metallopeptidase [bacterium]
MQLNKLTRFPLILGVMILAATFCRAEDPDWRTPYELSGGRTTPRYDATINYCQRLAAASEQLLYTTFGRSPRGRDLPLLILDGHGNFTPAAVRDSDNVVLLVQAGIHPGEICGKDAGLMLLRDLTVNGKFPGLLDHVTVLFIPIFSVDGHERFGPYNRVNQNGPEEMGWRVTAQNLNLNRDFLKADTPEMQCWLRFFNAWLPDFFIDIHSTDGADYQYAISYAMEVHGNMDAGVTDWVRDTYLPQVGDAMLASGFPLTPYVTFRRWHDPTSGLRSWVASPRLSEGYTALHNRPGLLIETHMMKPYPVRVDATYEMVRHTLELLNRQHHELRERIETADHAAAVGDLLQEPLPVRFEFDPTDSVMIDFLGVEFEKLASDLTGGNWFRYGTEPVTYRIPHFNQQRSTLSLDLPEAYLIPAEWAEVADRLVLHGVAIRRLTEPVTLPIRTYRFTGSSWQAEPYEGRHPATFQTERMTEEREFPAGSYLVDMRQRAARVAAHVLEPEAPDSYVYWGFFDAVFTRAEYVESYVIEEMARRMIADDPTLLEELEAAKAADPEFAADPWAIRYWFYAKTPYYDQRVNIYPVGLIDDRVVLDSLPLN